MITAVLVPPAITRFLQIRPRSPVPRVARHYELADGQAVEVAVSHYLPSRFEYVMTLYRE